MYHWQNLSDRDFEDVSRDLLAAQLDRHVEAFASGADGGIDLRCNGDDGLIIGQCKHYVRSTFSQLRASLLKELPKLRDMSPQPVRYVIFTSKDLSAGNKSDLLEALAPYVQRQDDIYGMRDIEALLVANPRVEAANYKLWLASAAVLQRIFASATQNRSDIRVQQMVDSGKLFVPHEKMGIAFDLLKQERSLIISGPAGVGKTTMAEMLALRFLEFGYEVVALTDVSDLEASLRSQAKQIFIFDDFLGRTNLQEAPSASSQERLFRIIRDLPKMSQKYLILTTREYLYREARVANETLSKGRAEVIRCLLDVQGYTLSKRAQILYNHLYWAEGLPSSDVQSLVAERKYWPIIQHENFNPRWIADTLHRVAESPVAPEEEPTWI